MKLLKVIVNNYKLCKKDFTISFLPIANKNDEDKEYELSMIDEDLYTFNTIGIVGKNASGKSTVLSVLEVVYDILSNFRIKNSIGNFKYVEASPKFDIVFYHEGVIYRYITSLVKEENSIDNVILFKNQELYKRTYRKTHSRDLFNYEKFEKVELENELPEDTSILYSILKNISARGIYYSSDDFKVNYDHIFNMYRILDDKFDIMKSILKMLDERIKNIEMIEENKYQIVFLNNKNQIVDNKGLYNILSSGTNKGFILFNFVVYSLRTGNDLIVDEIETHFHKALVENLVNLYKDKKVNKNHAMLIFSTHNAELLDLFNCDDNIFISKVVKDHIELENMHDYGIRPELSKTNKFYQNAFNTNVDYDALMKFKKELL